MPRECFEKGVNAQIVDELTWDKISRLLTNQKLLEEKADEWIKSRDGRQQNQTGLVSVDNELNRLDEEERRYTKSYGEGITPPEVYKDSMDQAKNRRNFLISQKCEIESRQKQKISVKPKQLAELAKTAVSGFNFENKRAIIRQLVEKVVATSEKLVITGYIPINLHKYMELSHGDRNSRATECREIDAV
jgi:hypothetical protein